MLKAVNHKINQVLTNYPVHIIFLSALLHNLFQSYREYYPAYYKFANLHNFGCTFEI
jgi:hypothetical protein